MAAGTLGSQKRAVDAAATISRVFPHLPAAVIQVSGVYPDRVNISLHDDLADFEAWRAALGILPEWVGQSGLTDTSQSLTGTGRFAGVEVVLTGYAPLLQAVAL